jgi:hypothetical protein
MRVGVIRGDLPGPIFMADLEPTSHTNFPTEPFGQTRYVSRPDLTRVGIAVAAIAATLKGTVNLTGALPITINGSNQVLRARVAVGPSPYVVVTVAAATYNSVVTLLAAVNAAITVAGLAATAILDSTGNFLILKSNTLGTGSFVEIDTVGNGSTFNAVAGFGAGGGNFTVPSAATVITTTLPVGGPLNVSTAALATLVGGGTTAAQQTAVADAIAPQFIDTDVAIKSFSKGILKGFLSASFSPDPSRLPPIAAGAAISVVTDDGSTLFTAPVPNISGAVHNVPNAGDITVTGVGLANAEQDLTSVQISNPVTLQTVTLVQQRIRTTVSGGTTGSVSATSIVIPASLLAGLGLVAGNKIQVRYTSLASNLFTTT